MANQRSWFSFGLSSSKNSQPRKLVFGGRSSVPGSPGVATPTWDVEKDTDTLFREHGIEEIKQIEKQTRLDIDSRKEDLRQMVGEKYRDLIDTADSIVDMQKCSKQVKESVSIMETLCQKLQQTHFLRGSAGMRGPAVKSDMHCAAAQLKLLSESPEKIWVCLEQRGHLSAAQHYLLARHVYSQLGLSVGNSKAGVRVQRLWQPISNFKETILECCRCHLQCADIEEELMVQSLCAIVLLEGCSPRQAFTQFLLARKAAIQSAFHTGSGVGQHRSVKSQVCHLVKTLLHSLLHIAAIFCQQQNLVGKKESSLLLQHLVQFSNKNVEGFCSGLVSEDLMPLLPSSITEFSPALRSTTLTEIAASDIHSAVEDWITTCASEVQGGVERLLQHVTSIKALSSIKSAIHSLLATPTASTFPESADSAADVSDPSAVPWSERWVQICQLILNRRLSIWETFFQPVLLQQVKLLLDREFESSGTGTGHHLTNLLNSVASDPAGHHGDIHCHDYLWRESSSPSWSSSSNSGGLRQLKDLTLKSKACTPVINGFCESLGKELAGLLEDVSHYLGPQEDPLTMPPTLASYREKQQDTFPFPLYADTASIQDHLQRSTICWINRFLGNVEEEVVRLKHSIREGSEHAVDILLVVGRLCQCLLCCCQSLYYLLKGARHHQTASRSLGNRSLLNKEANETAAELLQKKAISIFKVWSDWTVAQVTRQLSSHLSSNLQLSSLASSLVWSEITISEEAESGKKVSSVIHVPAQASTYISTLLFVLSQEVGRVGGHAMDQQVLEHLSGTALGGVVRAYGNLLEEVERNGLEIPQPCALQLYFDLKYAVGVLTPLKAEEEDLTKQIQCVLQRVQGWVDPFDLDVFMPYLLSNLENQLSKSSVMLGALVAVKGSLHRPHTTGGGGGGGRQDKHMVLPLAPVVGRIQVLPLSSKANNQQHLKMPISQDVSFPASLLQRISFFDHL